METELDLSVKKYQKMMEPYQGRKIKKLNKAVAKARKVKAMCGFDPLCDFRIRWDPHGKLTIRADDRIRTEVMDKEMGIGHTPVLGNINADNSLSFYFVADDDLFHAVLKALKKFAKDPLWCLTEKPNYCMACGKYLKTKDEKEAHFHVKCMAILLGLKK
nr:hypothetical protein 2 [Desulfobulbaceae bacterium]